jgi:hypothetical protein
VDVSCDFAIGFLGFVVINDLLSFENMFLFQKKKSLKENWIFSCMDWRTELRFELLSLTELDIRKSGNQHCSLLFLLISSKEMKI